MINKLSKLSGPEFKKAINQLFHGHRVAYDDICWLQIRRKKTLVVICASRYSKDNITQELGWITAVLADLKDVSEEFKRRTDSLRLAISLVDRLDRNRSEICTVYADSFADLGRLNYDVKWPLTSEEIEARLSLRKREAKSKAIKDAIREIPVLSAVLLMFFCVGAIAYFSARYFGAESVSVAVVFAVTSFGLVFPGSTVVEFLINIFLVSLLAYLFFTEIPRTQIMGFEIDIAVGTGQFLQSTLIGLILGLSTVFLVRFIVSQLSE